jgi:hypothetical protein
MNSGHLSSWYFVHIKNLFAPLRLCAQTPFLAFQNPLQIRRRIPNRLQGLVVALTEDKI